MVYSEGCYTVDRHRNHAVGAAKNRHHVLRGELRLRIGAIMRRRCIERGVEINKGVDHVHMLISVAPQRALSDVMGRLKADRRDGSSETSLSTANATGLPFLGEKLFLDDQRHHHRPRETSLSQQSGCHPPHRSYRRQPVVFQSGLTTLCYTSCRSMRSWEPARPQSERR